MWDKLHGFMDVRVDLSKAAPEAVTMILVTKSCFYPFEIIKPHKNEPSEIEIVKCKDGLPRNVVKCIVFIFCGGG